MNPLSALIRKRTAELAAEGVSIRQAAKRGGWNSPATLNYHLYHEGPLGQLPFDDVLEALSTALEVPYKAVWEAAVLSMLPDHPTQLQRLLRLAQARNGKRPDQLAEEAGITVSHLNRILGGESASLQPATVKGLAAAFGVSQREIREAAAESVDYRLPPGLAARMTPERWAELLRVAEALVSGDGD